MTVSILGCGKTVDVEVEVSVDEYRDILCNWGYLYSADHSERSGGGVSMGGSMTNGRVYSPTWAPDKKSFAYMVSENVEEVVPDGRYESIRGTCEIRVMNWPNYPGCKETEWYKETKLVKLVGRSSEGQNWVTFESLAWAPDGRSIFYVEKTDEGESLFRVTLDGKRRAVKASFDMSGIGVMCISPDGQQLAYRRPENESSVEGPAAIVTCNLTDDKLLKPRVVYESHNLDHSLVWMSHDEMMFNETESRGIVIQNSEARVTKPYRSTVWSVNIKTDKKAKLFQASDWQVVDHLTISPEKDAIAFTLGGITHSGGDLDTKWEPHKLPRPTIYDLKTEKVCYMYRPSGFNDNDECYDVNWSTPSDFFKAPDREY